MANPSEQADIVIVGGGMVGTPLALALAQAGWRVTLLDANARSDVSTSSPLSQRCTAISAGSAEQLDKLGLWGAVRSDACPIKKVHVSQRGFFGSVRMLASDHRLDALGYVVNNDRYLDALRVQLPASGVSVLRNARAVSFNAESSTARVAYESDGHAGEITTKLVIAVDGVASTMRDAVGIGIRQYNYEQCAVLGCVELEQSHDNVAYERFCEGGPLALLPRPHNIASFVYCIDSAEQAHVAALSDEAFLDRLQNEFGYRLGQFVRVGKRHILQLTLIEAQRQQQDRLLLLGNAMRLIHPVAGQGFNLAMRDIAGLLRTLSAASARDPGGPTLLAKFVNERAADQKRIVRLTDTLARSFRGYTKLPGHLRGAGLLAMAAVPQLGQQFTQQGLGRVSSGR